MDNQKKSAKKISLRRKLLFSIIIVAVVVSIASCLVGYIRYNSTLRQLYNDNGYVVGEIIAKQIDHEKIAQYAQTWEEDEYYAEMQQYLVDVQEASGAKYIYMAVPNGRAEDGTGTMRYIYDSSGCKIGDVDPVSKYYEDMEYTYHTGLRSDNRFERKSPKYGWLTSSIVPIMDSTGKTVAILFVDIAMELIVSTLVSYIVTVVLTSAALVAIFCLVYWKFMQHAFINPIELIRKNTHEFAENDAQISGTLDQITTGDELQDLAESVSSMEHSIVEYIENIKYITSEKERIGAELNVATHIQSSMLPCIFPAFPEHDEFDIYATMNPAKEVGGDFYDFFMVDETHIAIVMADVSGKGVPAALFMVIAKTLIKDHTLPGEDLGSVFTKVNDLLCESNSNGMFVTAFEAVLDIVTGELTFVNAGHEMPFICKNGDVYKPYKLRPGFVLAGMEGMRYRSGTMKLEPGDKLFQYTDGVPEATDADNRLFGMERLEAVLAVCSSMTPTELLPAVKAKVDEFVGDAPQFDDITMLCLEYKG